MRSILATTFCALLTSGCGLAAHTAEEKGARDETMLAPFALDVRTFNGAVEVRDGPPGQAHIAWTKVGSGETQAEAEADLKNVEVGVRSDSWKVYVVAKRLDSREIGASGASIVATVPKGTPVYLRTSNGGIRVIGVGSGGDVETSNGGVEIAGGRGDWVAKSANGALRIDGSYDGLEATTSNGAIRFSGTLDADRRATASSLSTSNGAIDVEFSTDAHLHLSAHASNGSLSCDLPYAPGGRLDKHDAELDLGAGGKATLSLRTSNGAIHVRQTR